RNQWSHFLPESITDLPLVARHASPSEIIIMYYLTIPFGIGSKYACPNNTVAVQNPLNISNCSETFGSIGAKRWNNLLEIIGINAPVLKVSEAQTATRYRCTTGIALPG
ncbi:hypothetical protein, partial [Providencia stuartii]|uniref:hypothetical protein n=1 Tax=Providencia stuartii TaxID=588 RepID=UPI0024AAC925